MKIKDIMSEAPACCAPDTKLDAVARLMVDYDCGEIPICDGTRLIGVVTDRDLACRGLAGTKNPLDIAVREIMTPHPYSVVESTEVDVAVELMARHQIRRLPVTRDGRVIGMVSVADLAETLAPLKAIELLRAISLRPLAVVPR